jgi:hypothetical protein
VWPGGLPLWTFDVRPGREHDMTCGISGHWPEVHGYQDAVKKTKAEKPADA